jgi:hypothetical protein
VAGIVVTAGELAGAWFPGINTPREFDAWATSTNQHRQTKLLLRAVTGLPKLLLHPGGGNILLKRYMLHDPYNPVSLGDIVWKAGLALAGFYLFSLAVMVASWLHRPARPWLVLLLASLGPILLFSVTVFEPSSPERFLCVLPFLFAVLAVALQGQNQFQKPFRWLATAFLAGMVLVNAFEMVPQLSQREQRLQTQLRQYRTVAQPGDLVLIAVGEPLIEVAETRPFDPLRRGSDIAVHQLLLPNSVQMEDWQFYFARRVLATWNHDSEVWFLAGTVAERPEALSSWVEGDDTRISWAQLQAFLHRFALAPEERGYVKLERTPDNEQHLLRMLSRERL